MMYDDRMRSLMKDDGMRIRATLAEQFGKFGK